MLSNREMYYPSTNPCINITRNTYILGSCFMMMATFQWYALQSYWQKDFFCWSTPMMIVAFLMVTLFHIWPALRHGFPFNLIFVIAAMELMILGAGLMCADMEREVLLSVIAVSAYYVLVMIIVGIILQSNMDANPFCFLTSFFLCMMISAILFYMHLALNTGLVLNLGYLIVFYTISAMTIYHSMVVSSEQLHLYEDDFILMGMLFCVDFVCLFLLAAMYFGERFPGSCSNLIVRRKLKENSLKFYQTN